MGLFDFFKRKKQEIKIEKVDFANLESWILDKKDQTKKQEQDFLISISNRISQFNQEIKQQIGILEKIDLNERKVEERIKLIVKENLDNYISHLRRLIVSLQDMDKESRDILKELDLIFFNFERRSRMSFQKATFIIGDELAKVREYISSFSKDFKNILDKNQDLIRQLERLYCINIKMKDLSKINNMEQEINRLILNNKKEMEKLGDYDKTIDTKIKQIKNSKEYSDEKEIKQELEKKKQELEINFSKLKSMLDFKALSNIFHGNKKEMRIIKKYKDNFKDAFEGDKGVSLSTLYNENNPDLKAILEKIHKITKLKEEIKVIIIPNLTRDLEIEKERNKTKISDLEHEIIKQEKRNKKTKESKENVLKLIKEALIKINVELVLS